MEHKWHRRIGAADNLDPARVRAPHSVPGVRDCFQSPRGQVRVTGRQRRIAVFAEAPHDRECWTQHRPPLGHHVEVVISEVEPVLDPVDPLFDRPGRSVATVAVGGDLPPVPVGFLKDRRQGLACHLRRAVAQIPADVLGQRRVDFDEVHIVAEIKADRLAPLGWIVRNRRRPRQAHMGS